MSRYRNRRYQSRDESILGLLMDVASLLPWWAGVLLAVFLYGVIHAYAGSEVIPVNQADPADFTRHMLDSAGRQFAEVAQYLVVIACLVGACFSAARRWRRKQLYSQVAATPTFSALKAVSWQEFESLVAETFRQKNYRVVERGGSGPDGGVDLELYQGEDKYLVQCKQWRTRQVGVSVVRELYGVMAAEGAVGGFVVASGSFTADALAFAEGKAIELVDARQLLALIQRDSAIEEGTSLRAVPSVPHIGARTTRSKATQAVVLIIAALVVLAVATLSGKKRSGAAVKPMVVDQGRGLHAQREAARAQQSAQDAAAREQFEFLNNAVKSLTQEDFNNKANEVLAAVAAQDLSKATAFAASPQPADALRRLIELHTKGGGIFRVMATQVHPGAVSGVIGSEAVLQQGAYSPTNPQYASRRVVYYVLSNRAPLMQNAKGVNGAGYLYLAASIAPATGLAQWSIEYHAANYSSWAKQGDVPQVPGRPELGFHLVGK